MKTEPVVLTADSALRLQPLRFIVAGGLATGVHWLAMLVLILLGAEPAWATAAGSVIGAIANYTLQRQLTFRTQKTHHQTVPRYLLSCAVAWTANLLLFYLCNQQLGLPTVTAQPLTTVAVAILNYFVFKRLVFHD